MQNEKPGFGEFEFVAADLYGDRSKITALGSREAAEKYAEIFRDYGAHETHFITVRVWLVGCPLAAVTHRVTLDPDPPRCSAGEHEWEPSARAQGGGVEFAEVCPHCSARRLTDDYAEDPETGEIGLRAVSYET